MARSKENGKHQDVPGNTLASHAAHERFLIGVGMGWTRLVEACRRQAGHGTYVQSIRLKGDFESGVDLLVIVSADSDEGPLVAFHNVDDPYSLWSGLANRIEAGQLKWRVDEYRK